jgi:processive 1,2-diacylglycerol beta-glucosyltransferase
LRRLSEHILTSAPDLVICTHFLPVPLIGRLIEQGALNAKLFVVITDDCVHRFWYAENVDHWFVPARCSCETLLRWRIDTKRITISGIPIQGKWTKPLDREKILSEWGLPADRKIVLLSGGTDFTCGPIAKIARSIVAGSPDAHVLVLTGHNKKLLAKVSALPEAGDRIIPVGFTDRLHELMEVCTLIVTKPGGIITAEALGKGTAMVLLKPVPGHEAGNARYFESEGAAIITRNVRDVATTVSRLLSRPEELAHLEANAGRLYRPGTEIICRTICCAVGAASSEAAQSVSPGES